MNESHSAEIYRSQHGALASTRVIGMSALAAAAVVKVQTVIAQLVCIYVCARSS